MRAGAYWVRAVVGSGLGLAVVVFALLVASASAPEESSRPNVLLILVDDMEATLLEAMPKTMELLVGQGLRFSQAHVSTPLCCPSRASILRGQYAHNHGVIENDRTPFDAVQHDTIATRLQDAGYHTAFIGKYLNGYGRGMPPGAFMGTPPGWTVWASLASPGRTRYYDYTMNLGGSLVQFGNTADDYQTDVLAGMAEDAIRQTASPWFLFLSFFAPHAPATPAPRHLDAFATAELPRPPSFNETDVSDKPAWVQRLPELDKRKIGQITRVYRRHLESLLAVDEAVERLVTALAETGQLERTYIIFLSDNGRMAGQHRIPFGKHVPYDESVRVPMVIRGPGVVVGETSALAMNVDLAPTIATLAGIPPPSYMDGASLTDLFGGGIPEHWRRLALLEWLGAEDRSPRYRALKSPQRLYVEYETTGERELYERDDDPFELTNLASSAPACLLDALHARLEALAACAGSSCRELESAPLEPTCP